jgi:hypothetical protein
MHTAAPNLGPIYFGGRLAPLQGSTDIYQKSLVGEILLCLLLKTI